ncbi:hypothetical protein Ancab_025908 [Ancistrocladus abbreviatus]
MVSFFHILFACLLGLTVAGQESVELLSLYDSYAMGHITSSQTNLPLAVSVTLEDLYEVSNSVLMAETWLRIHVLSNYPATKITHIIVGHNVLCVASHQDKFRMILPALKNFHYSLTRWGLDKEIKVSPSLSSHCLEPQFAAYRDDLGEKLIKSLLLFIQSTNSTYLVNPLQSFSSMSDETKSVVSPHLESMKKLGFSGLNHINVIINGGKETKPISRKLFSFDSKVIDPYPARPTPLPELSPSSSAHISIPAHIAKSPLPPLIGSTPPPPFSLPLAPKHSPVIFPATPPFGYHLPPCDPSAGSVPPPVAGGVMGEKLWCVAKPSVPAETLQEAMDYACGQGGAECDEIQPQGSCYYPDTVVAHASYAFNSYWQKNKRNGGTCSFGDTAMIINADPSFLNCRFIVS